MHSLLHQTWKDFEVVAVDDGSTDDSLKILMEFAGRDSRIHVVSRPNTGIVGALNDGLRECSGEFIARMDADDVSLPERLAAQVSYLRHNPDCVALGTDILYTDPEGDPLIRHHPVTTHDAIVAQLLEGNGGALIHPSVMFRRTALERVCGYRIECRKRLEDLDIYLRLSKEGKLANLSEVHLHYRQHLQSINRTLDPHESLRREIVNPFRTMDGLSPLPEQAEAVGAPVTPADWRRHWAYDAIRGGHLSTARKNASRALFSVPWDRRNWRCWRYVRSRQKSSPQVMSLVSPHP